MTSYEKQFDPGGRPFVKSPPLSRINPHLNGGGSATGSPVVNGFESARKRRAVPDQSSSGYMVEQSVTPAKASINTNITPRSGTRRARVESQSPTPHAMPNGALKTGRSTPIESFQRHGNKAQSTNTFAITSPPSSRLARSNSLSSDESESAFTFRRSPSGRNGTAASSPIPDGKPKFFHVNDVTPNKASTNAAEPTSWATGPQHSRTDSWPDGVASATKSHATPKDSESKFFYANDIAESIPSAPKTPVDKSRPALHTIYSQYEDPGQGMMRPSSPLKEEILLPRSRTSSLTSPDAIQSATKSFFESEAQVSAGLSGPTVSRSSSVRASTDSKTTNKPRRSSSLKSATPSKTRRSSIPVSSVSLAGPDVHSSPTEGKLGSVTAASNESPKAKATPRTYNLQSQPQSPTKSKSQLDHMNDLAANARRERKVLDLEISNSSLLAINQTMERELRKMKADLRHYRRASRNGKLFAANPRRKSHSGMTCFGESETDNASDEDASVKSFNDEADDDDDESFNDTTSRTSQASPTGNRAAMDKFKDTKFKPLDFASQRSVILESQKLNQSIKRCLGCSETLLSSGKQALESRSLSDDPGVLGPRVLTPEEIEHEAFDRRQGLLSPTFIEGARLDNPWERSLAQAGSLDGTIENSSQKFAEPADNAAFSKFETDGYIDPPLAGSGSNGSGVLELAVRGGESPWDRCSSPIVAKDDHLETATSTISQATSDPVTAEPSTAKEQDEIYPDPPDLERETTIGEPAKDYANTPGNRSSVQSLTNYLSSFKLFGPGGLRPP